MALPNSRNTTYAPKTQVKSYDLNDLQDMIVRINDRVVPNYFLITASDAAYALPTDTIWFEGIAIGGGGGGGQNASANTPTGAGGGGAGAAVAFRAPRALFGSTLDISIGAGGASASEGLFTRIAGLVYAPGGKPGKSADVDAKGGYGQQGGGGGSGPNNVGGKGGYSALNQGKGGDGVGSGFGTGGHSTLSALSTTIAAAIPELAATTEFQFPLGQQGIGSLLRGGSFGPGWGGLLHASAGGGGGGAMGYLTSSILASNGAQGAGIGTNNGGQGGAGYGAGGGGAGGGVAATVPPAGGTGAAGCIVLVCWRAIT